MKIETNLPSEKMIQSRRCSRTRVLTYTVSTSHSMKCAFDIFCKLCVFSIFLSD